MPAIQDRVQRVLTEVDHAATRAGRDPGSVTVVGVSKTVGREVVDAAYEAGIRHFGENRVMDAAEKFATPLQSGTTLHLIGQLQTNKAGVATRLFDIIESVDRTSLIAELRKQAEKLDREIRVLLQVNIAGEEQKSGCEPEDALALARAILDAGRFKFEGLMTIAPLVDDSESVRPVFRGLRELRDRLQQDLGVPLPTLSMGMTNDYPVAIEEGATHIRVGRAIFQD